MVYKDEASTWSLSVDEIRDFRFSWGRRGLKGLAFANKIEFKEGDECAVAAAIERDLTQRTQSILTLGLELSLLPSSIGIACLLLLALVILRSRLAQLEKNSMLAVDKPWLILDAESPLEFTLASLWMGSLFLCAPVVALISLAVLYLQSALLGAEIVSFENGFFSVLLCGIAIMGTVWGAKVVDGLCFLLLGRKAAPGRESQPGKTP